MNITLRKANAIQNNINDTIKGISFETSIRINEFQTAESIIASAENKFGLSLKKRDSLYMALYEIRKAVSKANDASGISAKLAEVAHLEKQFSFYSGLAGKDEREDLAVINGKLDKIRNSKEDARSRIYGYSDEVTVSILDREDLEGFKQLANQAKKVKQKVQDEILELNVRTEIQLSEFSTALLQAEGLL
jgi:hypothetical protein